MGGESLITIRTSAKRQLRLARLVGGCMALAACVAALAVPPVAVAAFPGENGKIAFDRDGDMWITDAQGQIQTRLTETRGFEGAPSFSPDGDRIVFVRSNRKLENIDLFVMDTDGTDLTRLTSHPAVDTEPAFFPGGRRIVFSRGGRRDSELYTMNLGGGNLTQITSHQGFDGGADVSPNGKRIVFTNQRIPSAGLKLFIVNADGTDLGRLTSSPSSIFERDATFAPDGSEILFRRGGTGDDDGLYTVEPDGSNLKKVIGPDYGDPAFSPDGRQIAFIRTLNCSELHGCDRAISVIDANGSGMRDMVRRVDGTLAWGAKGSAATPRARCGGKKATIVGTQRDDIITGTSSRDKIAGRNGDDTLRGRGGNDLLCGSRGGDVLRGGAGFDTCRGGRGRDKLRGCER